MHRAVPALLVVLLAGPGLAGCEEEGEPPEETYDRAIASHLQSLQSIQLRTWENRQEEGEEPRFLRSWEELVEAGYEDFFQPVLRRGYRIEIEPLVDEDGTELSFRHGWAARAVPTSGEAGSAYYVDSLARLTWSPDGLAGPDARPIPFGLEADEEE